MSETSLYVIYYIAQPQKPGQQPRVPQDGNETIQTLYPQSEQDGIVETQRLAVEAYLEPRKLTAQVIHTFVEKPENKRTNKWPQLERAVEATRTAGATLIIAELGTLTSNEIFTQCLLESQVPFYCCDQPFVNQTILEALHKHAQVQRKLHGKLIREGLKMTSAKSGNPNAAEVISKVNKPKIDTAIVFAFLLQPIISDYRRKGYSQRQMVKTLNEEGFTAPEGGKWVLSQLQKVLDRVRLNDVALEIDPLMPEFESRDLTHQQIADELNTRNIPPLKRTAWDVAQVKKLVDRIEQIKDIILINQFVLHTVPVIQNFRRKGLSEQDMIAEFERAGLPVRATKTTEVA